ncbi:acyltransferase [Sphingomonas sp. BN140010]|uniref:Acyltransferase n=1 Tax=Sphingomonas arvum TaxID=2992113 RepID=A0ABT3JG82_9SPHN|nr:acyltransferase [Sphingomonas sp. BN140010]MCW3798014.1 acyltransferase [Sphingomonas sp. BN140010]
MPAPIATSRADQERRHGLDSLRFLAILAVLFDHFVQLPAVQPGYVSTRFFLLLSGFLITRTLLRYEGPEPGRNRHLLRSFYGRRALRIWPLYYLILLGVLAAGLLPLRQFVVHAAFLTNIVQAWTNNWDLPWYLTHVWTLCVQEQFYLLWPAVMLPLGQRSRQWFLVALIGAAVLFRLLLWQLGMSDQVAFYTAPFASADALAAGSLLAIVHGAAAARLDRPAATIVALFGGCLLLHFVGRAAASTVLLPTLWLAPLGFLTLAVFDGRLGSAGAWLEWPPLAFLGRISLGIYLLHLPLWLLFFKLAPDWLQRLVPAPSWAAFLLLAPATIATAAVSWWLFEQPLQRFRRYLPYPARAVGPGSGPAQAQREGTRDVLRPAVGEDQVPASAGNGHHQP